MRDLVLAHGIDILNTRRIAAAFLHTDGYPMYVTNPSVVALSGEARAAGFDDDADKLILLRVTPLSYVCSPVHTLTIVQKRYAENSHTVLAMGSHQHPIFLANLSNSQDARGIIEPQSDASTSNPSTYGNVSAVQVQGPSSMRHHHLIRHVWVLHTTEVNESQSGGEGRSSTTRQRRLQRMQALQYKVVASTARLLSRATLHPALNASGLPSWQMQDTEKNWAVLQFEHGRGSGNALSISTRAGAITQRGLPKFVRSAAMLLSYSLEPHVVVRCGLRTGACIRIYETAAPLLWASAFSTVDDMPAYRRAPRCGTPCLLLQGRHVCFGHFKTRVKRQYKSTYFQFVCARALTARPSTAQD